MLGVSRAKWNFFPALVAALLAAPLLAAVGTGVGLAAGAVAGGPRGFDLISAEEVGNICTCVYVYINVYILMHI